MNPKQLTIGLSAIGALAGVIAIVTYFQTKTKRKLEEDIAFLDRQIKQLDLQDKIDHNRINGRA
jgi:hypothetical protein